MPIYAPPISSVVEDVPTAVTAAADGSGKPVVAVTLGRDDGPLAPGSPVPAFGFPEPAAGALGRVARYAAWQRRAVGEVPALNGVDLLSAQQVVAHALDVRPEGTLLPLGATATL